MTRRQCAGAHCVCCKAGATMTVERKAGLREPLCADCCVRLWLETGYRLASTKVRLPCSCGAERRTPVRVSSVVQERRIARERERMAWRRQDAELLASAQLKLRASTQQRLTVVLQAVAARYRIDALTLRARSHSYFITGPRGVAMYLMRAETASTFAEIGQYFRMHWTTVIHHGWLVPQAMAKSEALRLAVEDVRSYLLAPSEEGLEQLGELPLVDQCHCAPEVARYLPGGVLRSKEEQRSCREKRKRELYRTKKNLQSVSHAPAMEESEAA